jgi:phytoene/squalene synthetase
MVVAAKQAARLPDNSNLAFCYDVLNKVSRRWAGVCAVGGGSDTRVRAVGVSRAPLRSLRALTSPTPCYTHSFAVVIQQLPNPLRDAICVFYLVLRGLDTVEDDMAIPVAVKVPALLAFHENIHKRCVQFELLPWGLVVQAAAGDSGSSHRCAPFQRARCCANSPPPPRVCCVSCLVCRVWSPPPPPNPRRGFTMSCGYGHYKPLMAQFDVVVDVFLSLDDVYRRVIADITRRMGEGMADFIQAEVGGGWG